MFLKLFMENIFYIFIIIIIFIISYLVMKNQSIYTEKYTENFDVSGNKTKTDSSNNVLVISIYKILPYCNNNNNNRNLKSCKFKFKDTTYSSIFSTINNRASLIEDNIFNNYDCFNTDICNYNLYSINPFDDVTFSYIYMPKNDKNWVPIKFQILNTNIHFLDCLKKIVKDCRCEYTLDKNQENVVNIFDPVFNIIKIYLKKLNLKTNLNIYNFSLDNISSITHNNNKIDLSTKYMYCKLLYNGGDYYSICKY